MLKYLTKSELFAVVLSNPTLHTQQGCITLSQLNRLGYTAAVGNLYALHVYRLNEWKMGAGRLTRQQLRQQMRRWYAHGCKQQYLATLDC